MNEQAIFPKPIKWRSEKYLKFVRSLPCCHCGKPADHAHHIIGIGNQGGMGTRAPDFMAMPLCAECHAEIHRNSSRWGYQWEAIISTIGKAINAGVLK